MILDLLYDPQKFSLKWCETYIFYAESCYILVIFIRKFYIKILCCGMSYDIYKGEISIEVDGKSCSLEIAGS